MFRGTSLEVPGNLRGSGEPRSSGEPRRFRGTWRVPGNLQPREFRGTSGSSGTLKWIALSKSALWWSAERVVEHLKITSDDVLVLALPVYHVGGFGIVARAQIATCCFLEFCERWDPKVFADFCHQEGVTIASLVPTQVRDLVDAEVAAPPSLRALVVGGGALESELAEKAISLSWPVFASYDSYSGRICYG